MIDISADMGEGAPDEHLLWPLISSANIACGGHTGDDASMRESIKHAREHGVRIGAHPSYPDRENFGRVTLAISPAALKQSLTSQIASLRALAPIQFVKPHGALYNDAHRDVMLAALLVEVIQAIDPALSLVCPAASEMARAATDRGTHVIREAFADRRYEADGSLTPRTTAGSLLSVAEATEQASLLAREGLIVARDDSRFPLEFDTLCIHSDMQGAADRLRAIHRVIEDGRGI